MINHYLRATVARIGRTPLTTGANVLTLALGLACFIAAWGIVQWWQGADSYHRGAERIVVVGQRNVIFGQADAQGASRQSAPLHSISSWNLAKHLRAEFPEIETVARIVPLQDAPVVAGAEKAMLPLAIADPELLGIFDFDFVAGDPHHALDSPNSVVLTETAAARLFGDAPALGQSLLLGGAGEVTVTGVIRAVRQPSFMGNGADSVARFEILRDWESDATGRQLDALPSWIGISPLTVVRLPPSLSAEAFNARLPDFVTRRAPAVDRETAQIELRAFPVSELTTFGLNASFFAGGAGISAIAALLGLGLLTLLVACVNYANLATAQAVARAREIGLRKTLGANRWQIIVQTWVEAAVLTAAASGLALGILALAAPAVRTATGIDMLHFLSGQAAPVVFIVGLAAGVALLAGAWPALVLAGLRPAAALRPGQARGGSRRIAPVLVGVQFASASFLLILVMVTQFQRFHLERAALAVHEDPILVLNNIAALGVDYDTLATRLAMLPGVRGVSVVDHAPWSDSYTGTGFSRSQDLAEAPVAAFFKSVGYDYFDTLDLKLLAGRVFDRERDTVPVSLFAFRNDITRALPAILDRRLAEALGFTSPQAAVGQLVYIPNRLNGGRGAQPVEIIGVTETEWTRLGANNGAGHVYTFAPRALFGGQWPIVKISREDVAGSVAAITRVWEELVPAAPANIRFFDVMFEQSFRTYARISRIFALLAATAFVIASIGLLGMAVHAVTRRRREIGVRKTLGANTTRVLGLLLWDFSRPVLIANLVAWPFAFLAARVYLRAFADRIALTPVPFVLGLLVTLVIAWLAVGGQAWRAAHVRPALVLRTE